MTPRPAAPTLTTANQFNYILSSGLKGFYHLQHHEIMVYDTKELYGEQGNFRVLQFSDSAIQGALDLDDPQRIVFEYPRAIIHLMEFNNPSFEDVFMIGHGIGTIAEHFYHRKRCKIAELNEQVVELSKQHFGCRTEHVIIGDGRRTLEQETDQAYHYIILDAFTDKGTPRHLTTREFFSMTSEKLEPHGAIIINLMAKGPQNQQVEAIHSTMREIYSYTKAFVLPSEQHSDMQNMILIGANKPIGYQARLMAGFHEVEPRQGYIITDKN